MDINTNGSKSYLPRVNSTEIHIENNNCYSFR
jgi:hypothetical protein